ncbi:recombinase [Streptomyces spongiicola]|uniref:Recombinase n=1 Tax=Streptomyces spongiicola TaxID=1690221 RepID=A0ABM6V225_9ACTN|nr:recombinase [Streptomyces spongiicola]
MRNSVALALETSARAVGGQAALRAVDYLRVSTEQQTKGYGITYTGRATAAHIRRKGWEHLDTFKDEGESGTLPWQERPGASQIMELAQRTPRPFDVVVVFETRAIGRKNRVFWDWVWTLQDLGVFVAIVDEDIDNTTEDGEARMQEKAHEAFKELARIRKRTQGGIQQKALMGGFPGGQARYGYRIENRGKKGEQVLVVDDCDGGDACTRTDPCTTMHEAPALRFARKAAVRAKGNFGQVARSLNAEGFLTRSGRPWAAPHIRGILMNDDLLDARFVFRGRSSKVNPDGTPVWGESVVMDLDPVFSPDEVAEFRRVTANKVRHWAASRVYTLTGRIASPCGRHYVGCAPSGEAPHYVCAGKTAEHPGAPTCSCSQLDASGVEEWAWKELCVLLGDGARLRAMADQWVGRSSGERVDYSSRLADLDQKIAAQDEAVDIATVVAAKRAAGKGLIGSEAEAAVERIVKPLCDELDELKRSRREIEGWKAEAARADGRSNDLQELAQMAHDRLEGLEPEQQREFFHLLDVEITLTGPNPGMHRGARCPIGEWFRANEQPVPILCDHSWALVMESEKFPNGGTEPRQKGGLAPRTVLEAFLKKARTGAAWPELNTEYGSTGLIGHWGRWYKSGRWERVMQAMSACEGTPPAPLHPLPPMHMKGKIRPGVILAVSDRETHGQASGPSAAACCSSGRPWRADGRSPASPASRSVPGAASSWWCAASSAAPGPRRCRR